MSSPFIHRWVLSPVETLTGEDGSQITKPVVAEYCLRDPLVPRYLDGMSLCYCEMTRNQFEAASQDVRFIVLDSLYSKNAIPGTVASQLAKHGVTPQHNPHDMLIAMYQSLGDLGFLPDM